MTAIDESAGRSTRGSLERLAWWLDTPLGLVALFAVGLGIRLAIAPWEGFYLDLANAKVWAGALAHVGPHRFYSSVQFADYPPGYLYFLWVIGKISATPGYFLLKMPALLGDAGVAAVAGVLARRIAPRTLVERAPVRALVAAAVLFNPAILFDSGVFGEVDVVPTFFVLCALLLLLTGRHSVPRDAAAFALFGVAFSTKPQMCLALPVMVYLLYRRYLHRRPRPELIDGALAFALIALTSLGTWILLALPFGLGPVDLVHFYQHSSQVHPYTSSNAYNLWGVIGSWRNDLEGDHVLHVAGIPALYVGLLLFVAALTAVIRRMHVAIERGADEACTLALTAAVTSLLGYALLTRMHERYMFPVLALLAPVLFAPLARRAYVALSALFLLSLWFPFAYYNSTVPGQVTLKVEPFYGWIFGGFAFDTWQKRLYSAAVLAIALVTAWRSSRAFEAERPAPRRVGERPPAEAARDGLARARQVELIVAAEPEADTATRRRLGWAVPAALVGLASLFGLIVLHGELRKADFPNDGSLHLLMVRWAGGQIHEGRVPLDGWFPYFALGTSFFHHYQSLPHTLTAYLADAFGTGDWGTYLWIQYLLLALWPVSVYVAVRLLDWDAWTAAAAAAVSPLLVSAPGYGYEHGSYTWQGYGVYSQLWGMWLLPLAWGSTWRAVSRGRYYAAGAVALALTIACHFITGYLAILTLGVWVIVLGRSGFLRHAGRAAIVGAGSLLVAAWVVVPLVGDTKWTAESEYYVGSIFNDSHGASKILGWLFSGQLFDWHRFPVVSLLFLVGVVVCVLRAREDVRARALLGAFLLSLFLFFGRRTWGSLIDVLPGFANVQIHRFVMGVDLAAIMISGVGLAWLMRASYLGARRLATNRLSPRGYALAGGAAAILLSVVVLAPAWAERMHYDDRGAVLVRSQQGYDANDGRDLDRLIAIVKARNDGRVYAGLRANWGNDYRVGSVPVYAFLPDRSVASLGFVFRTITSLSTDVEVAFDETNPAQYQMLNVRYLLLPDDRKPSVPANLIASSGRHRLYEVDTTGYVQVVDRAPAISANRTNIEQASKAFRDSDLASRSIYPGVAFAGGAAPPPSFSGPSPPAGSPGRVVSQSNRDADGVYDAVVQANRPAVVVLKATYDPRWTVTVDGLPDRTSMIAPSLVGVEVPAGRHVVRFAYAPYEHYPLLLGIGALTLVGLILFPRRAAIRARIARDAAAPSRAQGS